MRTTIPPAPARALKLWQLLPAVAGVYITQTTITALITQALPTLLRHEGASLQVAGLSALLWVPWGIRFLWAPAVERWRLPAGRLKRRSRTLVLAGQWLIAAILTILGVTSLTKDLSLSAHAGWILGGLLLAALVSATADVACDGFAIDQLASHRRGWGNAIHVGSSYVGAMLGAGGFLLLTGYTGWPQALLVVGLAVILLSLPMWFVHEPPRDQTLAVKHRPSLSHALRRPQVRTGLLLLLLSSSGVRLTLGMLGPFLLDRGMGMEQVGWLFGSLHIGAGLTGAVLGGLLVRRTPGWQVVWIAVGLKACVFVVLAVAVATPSTSFTVLTVLLGLLFVVLSCLWVALYATLMGITSPLQSGVDFTVFQSADALLGVVGGIAGSVLAQHLGYPICFGLAAALTVLATVIVRRQIRAENTPPTTESGALHAG